jgi:hypothetical protein
MNTIYLLIGKGVIPFNEVELNEVVQDDLSIILKLML